MIDVIEQIKEVDDPLEKVIEKKVCDYARSKGFYVKKFVSPSNRSVPDDIFITPDGTVFFIEFKRRGRIPTGSQFEEHKKILRNNVDVHVIDTINKGKELIDEYTI